MKTSRHRIDSLLKGGTNCFSSHGHLQEIKIFSSSQKRVKNEHILLKCYHFYSTCHLQVPFFIYENEFLQFQEVLDDF
jgi:hypothetical protein